MPQADYELLIDFDDDGSFATAGDDVSDDLRRTTIDRGYANPLARMARVGRATFTLKNQSQQYSPVLDANVLPFREVKFSMDYNSTKVVLFRGFIDSIKPVAGVRRSREVVIDCVDAIALLDIFEGRTGIQQDVYADEIITDIVSDVYTPPSTNYQNGINIFPTSGERWSLGIALAIIGQAAAQERINAARKITDVCASDWGRFFIAKDGAPTFFNRHQMPLDSSTELTLNDDMQALDYTKRAGEVLNWIEVTYLPRTVGTSNEVLGRFAPERAVQIQPGRTETFRVPYRDPSNPTIQVGGLSAVTPVANTDYEATDDEVGNGDDVTGNLTLTFTAYADHAEAQFENTHATTDAFIQFLQVRGLPVRTREPETVRVTDATSIAAYGQRRLSIDATLMDNSAQAQALADYLLDVYKDPQDVVEGLTILGNHSQTFLEAVRDLELMDKVVLSETQTGLSSFSGHIYSMRHRINSRFEHWLNVSLETPYDPGTPFLIGDRLDSGHLLIY